MKKAIAGLMMLICAGTLTAVENFQLNTVFQRSTYPLFGTGGKDVIRYSAVGINLKSARGPKFHGVIDLTVLFPYILEEKMHPADDFSKRSISGFPLALDGVAGIGYTLDLSPMVFLMSAGFHTGSFFEGGDRLLSFGLGMDLQSYIHIGDYLTTQAGVRMSFGFGGTQNFVSGSGEYAGVPLSMAFYTGIGLSY